MFNVKQVKAVYQNTLDNGYDVGTFDEWLRRVKVFHGTPHGGVAFVSDANTPGLWWVNLYTPGELPDLNTLKWLVRLCFQAGAEFVAHEVQRPGSKRIMEKIGFQRVEENVYALKN